MYGRIGCRNPAADRAEPESKGVFMVAVSLMLVLLGLRARARNGGKGGRTYFLTALALLLVEVARGLFLGTYMMFFLFIETIPFLLVLLIVWGTTLLRDGWIFRTALCLWLAAFAALSIQAVLDDREARVADARTDANLLRCGELLKAGKREELRAFFRQVEFDDHARWNEAFEAAFPPE